MSITIKVEETTAWVSLQQMEDRGLNPTQLLQSIGEVTIKGKQYKITTLRDTETGQEIK